MYIITITATDKALLSACAEAMTLGQDRELDLHNLANDLFRKDAPTMEELSVCVETFSGGTKTVRAADAALFKSRGGTTNLNLVVCPVETPKEEVTELAEGMTLYYLGKYRNGLTKEVPASTEEIKKYRDFTEEADRKRRQEQQAKEILFGIVSSVLEVVKGEIDTCTDETRQREALSAIRFCNGKPEAKDLEYLAVACVVLGISFKEVLGEALK